MAASSVRSAEDIDSLSLPPSVLSGAHANATAASETHRSLQSSTMRRHLTIVIKLGTSSIVDEKTHEPLLSILTTIVETAVKLHQDGHKVIIVSSGAVGVGLRRMDMERRPKHLPKVQALAAIGQCRLMSLWDQLFAHLRQPVAQILLTRNDIADRTQYLNAQNTLFELLHMGVIPIVNENDTIAVSEIKFGDNDTLSAITAGMVQADYLFLMTDVDCLYDKNPRTNPDAKAIEVVEDISQLTADVSSAGSALGTGGMSTKIVAARLATAAGVTTVITKSNKPGNIAAIVKYIEFQKGNLLGTARCSSRNGVRAEDLPTDSLHLGEAVKPHHHNHHHHHDGRHLNGCRTSPKNTPRHSPPQSRRGSPRLVSSSRSSPQLSPIDIPTSAPLHTRFLPDPHPIRDRYFWILYGLTPHGTVYIDEGAFHAISGKAGLLPVGVVDVDGHFAQQEAVRIMVVKRSAPRSSGHTANGANGHHLTNGHTPANLPNHPVNHTVTHAVLGTDSPLPFSKDDPPPYEVGRAVVNYAASEIKQIKGHKSTDIHELLGYADSEYVALRENIAFFRGSRPATPCVRTPPLTRTPSRDGSSIECR